MVIWNVLSIASVILFIVLNSDFGAKQLTTKIQKILKKYKKIYTMNILLVKLESEAAKITANFDRK